MRDSRFGIWFLRLSLAAVALAIGLSLAACRSTPSSSGSPSSTWAPLPTIGSGTVVTDTATLTSTLEALPTSAPSATPHTEGTPTTVATHTATPAAALPASGPTPDDALSRATWARDQCWEHLASVEELPQQPAWEKRGGEAGKEDYTFEYDGWSVSVAVPAEPLSADGFSVRISAPEERVWDLTVSDDGEVTVSGRQDEATPAIVLPDLDGEAGDLSVLDGDTAELLFSPAAELDAHYVVVLADDALRTTLDAARQAGAQVQVWGVVEQAGDADSMRLLLERFAIVKPSPTPVPVRDSELVEGWTGRVVAAPGTSGGDYFAGIEPAGNHGIEGMLPRDQELLVELRDSGEMIRVWGVLDYGVDDYGQSRIVVSRLERLGG